MLGQLLLESVQLFGIDEGGGGVVGVAEEDGLGLIGDSGQDLIKVGQQGVLLQGDLHQLAATALNIVIVAGISGRRENDLISLADKHLGNEAQAGGSALGDHDLLGGQAVLHGQLLAQVLCPDIGIAVGQGGLLANSLSRLGGGTKGVFVGGKLQQLGHPGTHTLGLLISANHIRGCFFYKIADQILDRHVYYLHILCILLISGRNKPLTV